MIHTITNETYGYIIACCNILLCNCLPNTAVANTPIFSEVLKFLPTLTVACIAGFLALYQMKSNIISSARIRWIEDLKDALSKLYPAALDTVVCCVNINDTNKDNDSKMEKEYYKEYGIHLANFNSLSNKIKMQLNSEEPEHKAIEDLIDKIDMKLGSKNIDNVTVDEIETDLKQIVILSKIIFKVEWKKSKRIIKI